VSLGLFWQAVWSGHVSGLFVRSCMTAGPQGFRGSGSNHPGALEAR
jgi:hypothetical protein